MRLKYEIENIKFQAKKKPRNISMLFLLIYFNHNLTKVLDIFNKMLLSIYSEMFILVLKCPWECT